MPSNVGPPTRMELRQAHKSLLSRLFAFWFKASGYSLLFGRNSFRMPPNRTGADADAFLGKAFELDDDAPESPIGLPEAELTIEDQHKAQEEFRRRHPPP